MDPLSAFINDEYPLNTPQQQQQHYHHPQDQPTPAQTVPAQHNNSSSAGLVAGDAVPIGALGIQSDDDEAGSAVTGSRLSPPDSLGASPPRTCPVDVPGSNSSSSNGATAAAAAHAGADAGTSTAAGVMPPLSPPDPDLNPEMLEQLLQKASPAITDNRFSMADFLKNKAAMTTAARRELAGGADHTLHRPTAEDDDITTSLEGAACPACRERGRKCIRTVCRKGQRACTNTASAWARVGV